MLSSEPASAASWKGGSPGVVRGSGLGEALEGADTKADGGLLDPLGCSHHTCNMIIRTCCIKSTHDYLLCVPFLIESRSVA